MKRIALFIALALTVVCNALAVDFSLAGNTTSGYLKLLKSNGDEVVAASSSNLGTYNAKYNYTGVEAGTYTVVGVASDKTTVNGKMKIAITDDSQGQTYQVCTVTTGISNSGWKKDTDWTADKLTITDNSAKQRECEVGTSTTANRVSLIVLRGDTYVLTFKLSDARIAQGYFAPQASATVTSASTSSSVSCEQLGTYSVVVDKDVELSLGWKTGSPKNANGGTHFIPLNNVEPTVTDLGNGKKQLDFKLIDKYYYIYNASMPGKRSLKGFFCFYATDTKTKCPALNLTAEDFGTVSPKNMITDPAVNSGSNVADIIMNINEKGYLSMNVGDERDVFAQRNWQLINSIMNYYVDPDYHYEVININGEKDNSVITFDTNSTTWNPWVKMKAVGKGTAIVLVTYDACKTKIHSNATATSNFYFNNQDGEWSALWPENTGVYVVTVGEKESAVVTGMKNAEGLNVIASGANKGKATRYAAENVDAELDVFYYTEGDGYKYSFKPENAAKVEIAYPVIGAEKTTYKGFSETGVSVKDGVYTVLLKHGSNIVRLQDAAGNYTYQVLRAKKAAYEITNLTREGATPQAGDKLKIQYSGLYHPCNKLSGIYNMTGAIVYQGVANDNSIVGGSGQYNFGGTPAAQAFTISIPKDYDSNANGNKYNIGTGLLRSSGYGSAYGAHRYITRATGATPNMNAVVGTAYFGGLPEIAIATQQAKVFGVKFNVTPTNASIVVKNDEGTVITPDAKGYYNGICGTYTYSISAEGYKRIMNQSITLSDTSADQQTITIALNALSNKDWDGTTVTEPSKNADGYYEVGTGAELAWIAKDVNSGNYADKFIITNDISLGSYDWTPIGGNTSSKAFKGECKGNGHVISDLYINSTSNYVGLFGYAKANISGITVNGQVATTGSYAGGIAGALEGIGYSNEEDWRTISDCANHATISAKTYVGGILGTITTGGQLNKVSNDASVTATYTSISQGYAGGIVGNGNGWYTRIYNAYNLGAVKAMAYVGGIAGSYGSGAMTALENAYNLGQLTATSTNATYAKYCGSIVGGNTSNYPGIKNAYTIKAYTADMNATILEAADVKSGKLAALLGAAFGQNIGVDAYPVLGGAKVYAIEGKYTNEAHIDFEDVNIPAGSTYYNGSDEAGLFSASGYSFMNYYNASWASWNGFATSATTGNDFTGYVDDSQYNSCTGGGMESRQFAVGYYSEYNAWYEDQYPEIYATKNFRPEYVYVTNSANTLKSMLNGDSYAKKFTADDYLLLTITGLDANDDEISHVDFYLAKDGKFVDQWTKVDLSSLGVVNHLRFTMDSSDKSWGFMNTPAYFCLDNMKAALTDEPVGLLASTAYNGHLVLTVSEGNLLLGPHVADVTYKTDVYQKSGAKTVDVTISEFSYNTALIGKVTFGTYTVKGLKYDAAKGGYYRDYAADGLSEFVSALKDGFYTMNSSYPLAVKDNENIFVQNEGADIIITNNFQLGDLPLPLKTVFSTSASHVKAVEASAIVDVPTAITGTAVSGDSSKEYYNLSGQRVTSSHKGILINNGKKIQVK